MQLSFHAAAAMFNFLPSSDLPFPATLEGVYGKNAIAPKMTPSRKGGSMMAALRYTHQSSGLSEESRAVPVPQRC